MKHRRTYIQPDNRPVRRVSRKPDNTPYDVYLRRKRRILAAAACLLIILCLGTAPVTYSYLTSESETVVNTFAGGAISMTLTEAQVDADGQATDDERVQENSYKIIPGRTLSKDPTVTVLEGSEACYVYLYIEDPLPEEFFTIDYVDSWIELASDGEKTIYVYQEIVDAADGDLDLIPVFTQIVVSEELTSEQVEELGEIEIVIKAYAVQAEGIDEETAAQMAVAYFEAEFEFTSSESDES